jgi:hypothetical protein
VDVERTEPTLPDAWEFEHLRVSIFATGQRGSLSELWQSSVGGEPLNESTDRNGPFVVHKISGLFNEALLTMQSDPSRLDLILTPNPGIGSIEPYFVVGPYQRTRTAFFELARSFITNSGLPSTRLALGMVLLLYVPSREEGYAVLNHLLPFQLNPASRDFMYRINNRRMSRTGLMEINRLNEWSVLEVIPASVMIGQGPHQLISESPTYLGRLSLDLNTVFEFQGLIDTPNQLDLLGELAAMSDEFATEGDRL